MREGPNEIILASASPRRAHLLESIGLSFQIDPSQIVEEPGASESPTDYIMRVARAKTIDVARRRASGLVVGADTEVIVDGAILGKPRNPDDAVRMLNLLSGRWHTVATGLVIHDASSGHEVSGSEETEVRFAELTKTEITWYVASGEPFDKAGAYAIQGLASLFVKEIRGTYHNVVGLPVALLYRLLDQIGYPLIPD